jgi:hypothetical protein
VDHVVGLRQSEKKITKASSVIKLGLGGEVLVIRK